LKQIKIKEMRGKELKETDEVYEVYLLESVLELYVKIALSIA
jgi:hypothetical protein